MNALFLILSFLNPSDPAQEISETYRVRVHQLQVKVLDDDGNPLKGLKEGDFTVKLNGKDQEVVSVQSITLDQETEGSAAMGRRSFFFLFDMENNSGKGIRAAREHTIRFIEEDMLPGDIAAVFSFSGQSIVMSSNLTSDKQALMRSVREVGVQKIDGPMDKAAKKKLAKARADKLRKKIIEGHELAGLGSGGSKFDSPLADVQHSLQEVRIESKRGQMLGYLDQFETFASYLKVMEGDKNLVLFSSGMQNRMAGVMNDVGNVVSTAGRLVETLQGSGAVVYIVDPNHASYASRHGMQIFNDLSASTGGKVFNRATDAHGALKEIKQLTNHFYLVNIQSSLDLPKGELARVKVKVSAPDAAVKTTKGLLINPDYGNLSAMERRLMLTDLVVRDKVHNQVPVSLGAQTFYNKQGAARLNLDVEIPGDYLIATSKGSEQTTYEIMAAAVNRDTGSMAAHHYHEVKLAPGQVQDHLEKSGVKYFVDLMVDPGRYQVKLVVRNPANGQAGTAVKSVTVRSDRNNIHAGPVMVSTEPWIVIDTSNLEPEQPGLPYPYGFGKDRFVPVSQPRVQHGDVTRLLFLVDRDLLTSKSGVEVAVLVMDQDGAYQQASGKNMNYRIYQDKESPWSGLLVSLNTQTFSFEKDQQYKFYTRITVGGKDSLLAALPFEIEKGRM